MPGLSDFAQLMTRYYLIGFFVPLFSWLAALDLALSSKWKPEYFDTFAVSQFAALAALAALLALLAVPWRHALFAAAAGGLERGRPPWFPYGKEIDKSRKKIKKTWGEDYSTTV